LFVERLAGKWVTPDTHCPSVKDEIPKRACSQCELVSTSKESKTRHNNYLHNAKFIAKLLLRKKISKEEVELHGIDEEEEAALQAEIDMHNLRQQMAIESASGSLSRQIEALQLAGIKHNTMPRVPRLPRRVSFHDGSILPSYSKFK